MDGFGETKDLEYAQKEIEILKRLDNTYVIKFFDYFEGVTNKFNFKFIVTQYCEVSIKIIT